MGGEGEGDAVKWLRARLASRRAADRPRRPLWQELPVLVVLALVLAFGIKTFGVQAFSIPSGSMQNTLQTGTGCWWTS